MINKIDGKLLNIVKSMASEKKDVECLVYANNYLFAKRYLKNLCGEILELPFIHAFAVKTDFNKILHISNLTQISFVASISKVFAQMDTTRKVLNIDDAQKFLLGEGVTVAIIDTGISENLDFFAFKKRIVAFKDFVNNRKVPYDDNGHGTFVAGVLAGNGFMSGKKYSGVAPKANIVMVKALDNNGETGAVNILNAMQWIYENRQKYNIKVVCMSFGSEPLETGDPLMLGAEALWDAGIVVVAAAGNSGPEARTIKSPGVSGKIITVGALDDGRNNGKIDESKFKIATFSRRGPVYNFIKPDCIACGVDIVSLSNNRAEKTDLYTTMSGTSVSTPIVAGAVVLLVEKYPNLSPIQIKNKILSSCELKNLDSNYAGFGVIDFSKLIN